MEDIYQFKDISSALPGRPHALLALTVMSNHVIGHQKATVISMRVYNLFGKEWRNGGQKCYYLKYAEVVP